MIVPQRSVLSLPDKVERGLCSELGDRGYMVCGRCRWLRLEAYMKNAEYDRVEVYCDECDTRFASDKFVEVMPDQKPLDPSTNMGNYCKIIPPFSSPWFWVLGVICLSLVVLLTWLLIRRLKYSESKGSVQDYNAALEEEGTHQNISQVAPN